MRVQGDSKLNLFCKQVELEYLLHRRNSVVPETLLRSLLAFGEASEVVASTRPSQYHRFGTTPLTSLSCFAIETRYIGNDRHKASAEAARGYDRTAHALKVI